MAVDVSIIIVAWNVKKLLVECLRSVYAETRGIAFEVIYVDNASRDGSVEAVRQEFPEVKIIENADNKGFIKANNQGIEVASGRYVLLLNSDTIVLDNAIAKTVQFADQRPDAAVIGCRILNPDRTLQRSCFMYPSVLNMFLSATYLYKIFPRNRFFGREMMTWWDFDEVREVEVICGCFALVRKSAIDKVGMMDPAYFVYGDDPDWCYRFAKAGWKVLFMPGAEIIHLGGQTTKQAADRFKLQLYGSKLIFVKKFKSPAAFRLSCFEVGLFFLLRVPFWFFWGLLKRGERERGFKTAKTYLVGSFHCFVNWKNLLMNKEELKAK